MATKERLPRRGSIGISDCRSYRVKPVVYQDTEWPIYQKIISLFSIEFSHFFEGTRRDE